MRRSALVLASVLMIAACGSSGPGAADTLPPPATDGSTGTSTPTTAEPDRATTDSTEPGTRPEDPPEPVAPPEDDQGPNDEPPVRLSIEDALLPDEALPPPWEPQWRRLDRIGYPAGPNQTDCDEYWEYESLLGGAAAEALWWMDGGNANHYVVRMDGDGDILTTLISITTIAGNCPTVTWKEGGSFTTEMIEFDDAIALRFDAAESGEVTWVLLTTSGDLVSLLQMPLWARPDGMIAEPSRDELAALGSQMLLRLERAGPELTPPTSEPRTTLPQTTLPRTTLPPVTQPPAVPASTTTLPPEGLGELLLTADEVPEGWEPGGVERYDPGTADEEFVEACPPAASTDLIELVLEWEADYTSPGDGRVFVAIGEFDSAAEAATTVRDFGLVADCDFAVLIPDAIATGGIVDVQGADLAARLIIESPELEGATVALMVAVSGPIVVVLSEEVAGVAEGSSVTDFAHLTMTKIAAARG